MTVPVVAAARARDGRGSMAVGATMDAAVAAVAVSVVEEEEEAVQTEVGEAATQRELQSNPRGSVHALRKREPATVAAEQAQPSLR